MTAGTKFNVVEDDLTGTGGAIPSCGWGCDHDDVKWAFHKTETGEVFEHTDLVILHQWLGEVFGTSLFPIHEVRWAVLDCLRQSAEDHGVGAESVTTKHVIIYDGPNEWQDTLWVATQYGETAQATYGWNEERKARCYCD